MMMKREKVFHCQSQQLLATRMLARSTARFHSSLPFSEGSIINRWLLVPRLAGLADWQQQQQNQTTSERQQINQHGQHQNCVCTVLTALVSQSALKWDNAPH
ncbi:hypothetical protein TYRP_020103 [Tyrophagus putrescentiae]|nr:hypothetical protein TYRP_020103 [Tyrophagus putrescentiae]